MLVVCRYYTSELYAEDKASKSLSGLVFPSFLHSHPLPVEGQTKEMSWVGCTRQWEKREWARGTHRIMGGTQMSLHGISLFQLVWVNCSPNYSLLRQRIICTGTDTIAVNASLHKTVIHGVCSMGLWISIEILVALSMLTYYMISNAESIWAQHH